MSLSVATQALTRKISRLFPSSEAKIPDVQDIHRAFRTVIVLLSSIQKVRALDFNTIQVSRDDRYELKVLNAVSTIMVIEHEVVAVAAKRDAQSVLDLIVMCTHLGNRPTDHNPSDSMFRNFFVSLNSRKETFEIPHIIESTCPHWIQPDSDFVTELENYLAEHRDAPSFDSHLWVLNRLLIPQSNTPRLVRLDRLLKYVIATCYRKILRRWNDETLSLPYYASLQHISSKTIRFQELRPDVNPKKDSKRDKEVQNDDSLLESIDSRLADNLGIKIPQLVALQHGPIYTEERCNEFHQLLCALLEKFATSLEALPVEGNPTSPSSQSRVNGSFKDRLGNLLYYGCYLKWIVDGSALDHYLHNLETEQLLDDHRRDIMLQIDPSGDYDPDLHRPTASKLNGREIPCWKSYKQWLKLMLIYFTATETVIGYVTGPRFRHDDITINRLALPQSSPNIKPFSLSHLLSDKKGIKLPMDKETITGISEFITSLGALKPQDTQKLVHDFQRTRFQKFKSEANSGRDLSPDTKNAIRSFSDELVKHNFSPVGNGLARRIHNKVSDLFQYPPNNPASLGADICEMIQLLANDVDLYANLTVEITGSRNVHCEVSLATFLILSPGAFDGRYDHIIEKFKGIRRIIGVSKRCCPTCYQLIRLLTVEGKEKDSASAIIVKDRHNTITPCALPEWLPPHISLAIYHHFAAELATELINLKSEFESCMTPATLSRFDSTDTRATSLDSREEHVLRDKASRFLSFK